MDYPGFSKRDLMAYFKDPKPSKHPTTATDKLYKAEYEYREFLLLANAAKHRYKQDHEALHTEMRFGGRGNSVNSTFMCRERNIWLECITKATAVKKQVTVHHFLDLI